MLCSNFEQEKIFNGQSDKPSKDMKGVEQKFTTQPSANNHPTVKPTTLMSYLITLGSRKGDVVLDPFAGSGTTAISCVFSERNYLLIEREKEYLNMGGKLMFVMPYPHVVTKEGEIKL